ncbi:class I SAM-dependent methyltransferase [Rhodopirellula sp. MGV]|uniref:class I SAM-dependent methyltransferase n=1 Tax=Rhodopirellula sp. MGV TaxID=2023130 RepID=UPI000B976DB5|nr:class I SAM-dependent methyltransferase [Rhodopirellula sp. MGV]OYP38560.1 SAM-dependent methyltransferase [Rhodopirellula sp. MGV]PNY34859.1 SAM-dependent methyltransferase [Rhodopirellula baltica]
MIDNSRPFNELGRYELIDFGNARKLERVCGRLIDRPSPAAEAQRRKHPNLWGDVDSFFDKQAKQWRHQSKWPEDSQMDCGGFVMPIQPTPFGHLGVFPEQAGNWKWLRQSSPVTSDAMSSPDEMPRGLNLFAYTGASSMAMASSGMSVVHVDAAKPNVAAARVAAGANGLSDHPVRYLVDDAAKFATREVRRERTYHTIVLDPPAYGHSPRGKAWRLERDLWPLLDQCVELLDRDSFRLLITGHSPQVGAPDVVDYLHAELPERLGVSPRQLTDQLEYDRLTLTDRSGRQLDFGFFVRLAINR